jgi:hypothetical protein
MPLSLALETRALKEKERVSCLLCTPETYGLVSAPSHAVSSTTTPTTTTTPTATDLSGPVPPWTTPNRTKGKSSTSNGRASSTRSKTKTRNSRMGTHTRRLPSQNRVSDAVLVGLTHKAGSQLAQSHFHSGSAQQPQPQWQDFSLPPLRNAQMNPQPWLAGPASGFIEERIHVSVLMPVRFLRLQLGARAPGGCSRDCIRLGLHELTTTSREIHQSGLQPCARCPNKPGAEGGPRCSLPEPKRCALLA